jgi:hypothetical protein
MFQAGLDGVIPIGAVLQAKRGISRGSTRFAFHGVVPFGLEKSYLSSSFGTT